MAKFKVDDMVIALRDSIDITEGDVYEVTHTYGKEIRIIDDVGDGHVVDVPNKTDIELSLRWGEGMTEEEWFKRKETD